MVGKLIAVHGNSITVRNDKSTKTFQVNPETTVWRGHDVGVRQLRVGDNLAIQYSISSSNGEAIATGIWANIDRWAGTITKVFGDRVQIGRIDDHGDSTGNATIIFDSYTSFSEGISKSDLLVGRFLETTGLVLGKHRMKLEKYCILMQFQTTHNPVCGRVAAQRSECHNEAHSIRSEAVSDVHGGSYGYSGMLGSKSVQRR